MKRNKEPSPMPTNEQKNGKMIYAPYAYQRIRNETSDILPMPSNERSPQRLRSVGFLSFFCF